jgi:primase-polymerase (primpol)-like protein
MPNMAAVPDFLIDQPRWLAWRYEKRGDKSTKVPVTARNTVAKTNDPRTWADFAAIADAVQRNPSLFDGLGIVLGDLGIGKHLCGVDLDCCLDKDRAVAAWATPFANWLAQTYVEISPSRSGLKGFFKCPADVSSEVRTAFCITAGAWGRK